MINDRHAHHGTTACATVLCSIPHLQATRRNQLQYGAFCFIDPGSAVLLFVHSEITFDASNRPIRGASFIGFELFFIIMQTKNAVFIFYLFLRHQASCVPSVNKKRVIYGQVIAQNNKRSLPHIPVHIFANITTVAKTVYTNSEGSFVFTVPSTVEKLNISIVRLPEFKLLRAYVELKGKYVVHKTFILTPRKTEPDDVCSNKSIVLARVRRRSIPQVQAGLSTRLIHVFSVVVFASIVLWTWIKNGYHPAVEEDCALFRQTAHILQVLRVTDPQTIWKHGLSDHAVEFRNKSTFITQDEATAKQIFQEKTAEGTRGELFGRDSNDALALVYNPVVAIDDCAPIGSRR